MHHLSEEHFLLEKEIIPSDGYQPPHLVYPNWRINIFRHPSNQIAPLCLRNIYTVSLSFFNRWLSCNQIKNCVTSSTHPHINCDQNLGSFVFGPCVQGKNNFPICLKKINPHDVSSESPWTIHPHYIPIYILLYFIITLSVDLLIKVPLLLLIWSSFNTSGYILQHKKPRYAVCCTEGSHEVWYPI